MLVVSWAFHSIPNAQITATDISPAALTVAQRNAKRLQLDQVTGVQGDWLQPLRGQRFDMIVANPPYIASDDAHLTQGDLRFEPHIALASGHTELNAIDRIVHDARSVLVPGGYLLFEHGWEQGQKARALLQSAGYTGVFTARDLAHHERISGGQYLGS